jgi:hypothetical protein
MTLREKFKLPIDAHKRINNYVAEQCEQIADDYAIEFVEWLKDKPRSQFNRESLEQFKKEKGL